MISSDPNKATWIGSNITPFAGIIQPKPKKGSRKPPNKWNKVEHLDCPPSHFSYIIWQEESQRLIELVETYGDKRWKKISQCIGGGKTGAQCGKHPHISLHSLSTPIFYQNLYLLPAQHWKRVLCPEIRKGTWYDPHHLITTPNLHKNRDVGEEETLLQLVAKYGQAWKKIAIELKSRTGRPSHSFFTIMANFSCSYQIFSVDISTSKLVCHVRYTTYHLSQRPSLPLRC